MENRYTEKVIAKIMQGLILAILGFSLLAVEMKIVAFVVLALSVLAVGVAVYYAWKDIKEMDPLN